MIGSLGMPELIFILLLALLVFGPKRLPQVGRTLGKGLREFRRATTDLKRTVEVEMNAEDPPAPRPVPAATPAPAEGSADADTAASEPADGADGAAEPTAAEPAGPESSEVREKAAKAE